jgi:hypothetical protein
MAFTAGAATGAAAVVTGTGLVGLAKGRLTVGGLIRGAGAAVTGWGIVADL